MKKLLLIPIIGLWAFTSEAQTTNVTLTVQLSVQQLKEIRDGVDIINFHRTNASPPQVAWTAREAVSNLVQVALESFIRQTQSAAIEVVVDKFRNATPAKQAAVLETLK